MIGNTSFIPAHPPPIQINPPALQTAKPRIGFLARRNNETGLTLGGSRLVSAGSSPGSSRPNPDPVTATRSSTGSIPSSSTSIHDSEGVTSETTGSTGSSPNSSGSATPELNGPAHHASSAHSSSSSNRDKLAREDSEEELNDVNKSTSQIPWKKGDGTFLPTRRVDGLLPTHQRQKEQHYRLSQPSAEEKDEVLKLFENRPEMKKNYAIVSLQKVDNPVLTQQFEAKMGGLGLKADNPALLGTWDKEPEQETRKKVYSAIEKRKSPTKYKNVFTVTAFHATREKILGAVLKSGLDFLGRTDQGYFGQGTYFTTYPEYAVNVYSRVDGIVLICKICFRTLFPVASCDDLMAKPIKATFDGHYAHVVPKTSNPNEVMFVSMNPFQTPKYDELVVRDSSQILIQYVMQLKPTGLNVAKVETATTRKELRQVILKYLEQNPFDDQFVSLNKKLSELESSLNEPLNPSESNLFLILQRSLGEQDVKVKTTLGERVKNLLMKEVSEETPEEFQNDKSTEYDTQLRQANQSLLAGKHKKALKEFQEVLNKAPHSLEALIGAGQSYIQLNDFTQAIDHFGAARKIDPKNEKASSGYVFSLVRKAAALVQTNEFAEALQNLMEALELDPKNVSALGICACIYFAKKDSDIAYLDLAYSYCGRALNINRKDPVALRVRGAILMERGRKDEALDDLTQSIKNGPHPFAYLKKATLYLSIGRFNEAESDCTKLLNDDPAFLQARIIRGKVRLMQGNLPSAEKDLIQCHEMDGTNLEVLSLLGELYLQKKEGKKGLKYLTTSIEWYQKLLAREALKEHEKRNFYQVLLTRAKCHVLMNSSEFAQNDFHQAMVLNPNNPEAYSQRGNFYQQKGQKEKAEQDFAKALSLAGQGSQRQNASS